MLKRLLSLWMLIWCAGIPVLALNPVEKPTSDVATPPLETQALTSSAELEELRETLTTAKRQRKKIGLVLSGGGARGFAHIGVLEWFEENRIPVDCIAGTSMGALVGGMYTMGMKPKEIRAFMKSIDWNKA
ncbi:MAG TPA: patatin-like phospholipase family protein, partial [Acidobacteriota bacterium]|nr:patatin-like phospholipase family protein [Acidobacteriota bacterium]